MKKYSGIALILVIAACSNTQNPKEADLPKSSNEVHSITNVELENDKLQLIYDSYVHLKDALVLSKYDEAKTAASSLEKQLSTYEGCENTSLIAKKISVSKDLAGQRKDFTYLSSDVIALFNHATIKKGTIYVEHCPMANKGDGGSWLSSEKKIQNPYYGEEMMECGSVKQEFKASI